MNYLKTPAIILLMLLNQSCLKDLDKKPSTRQVTPNNVADLQTLMNNQRDIYTNRPTLGELGADDYYTTTENWDQLDIISKNGYIWAPDPFQDAEVNDWNYSYTTILYANVVLEKLTKLEGNNPTEGGKYVGAQARFHRALNFWLLAQLFCKPYVSLTATNDLGIPLRLSPDPTALAPRATVQETYDRIIQDLLEARQSLRVKSDIATRPTRIAADALLARVYLSMGDFNNAWHYANECLQQYSTLLDYNNIPSGAGFKQYNEETILFATMGSSRIFNNSATCPVDSTLYNSYDTSDLRKKLFFDAGAGNAKVFKGSYSGPSNSAKFCGLTTAEVFLIRAECYARKDSVAAAMQDLNTLMIKRWNTNNSFKPLAASTKEQALAIILKERRKELVFRGLRWSDLRRLNILGYNITLTRIINNNVYTLPPLDPRYVYPIPVQEFEKNPIPQNER